jgi:hypothetical protein
MKEITAWNMAFTDDYLFASDNMDAVNAYALAEDGGLPTRKVCTVKGLRQSRGLAIHKATGTLLIACLSGYVHRLDIRPPPSDWKLVAGDQVAATNALSLALDEPNGFLYAGDVHIRRITQFALSVCDKPTAPTAPSTVRLQLTGVRCIDAPSASGPREGLLFGIALLRPDTLLVSHMDSRVLTALTIPPLHATAASAMAMAESKTLSAAAATAAKSKLTKDKESTPSPSPSPSPSPAPRPAPRPPPLPAVKGAARAFGPGLQYSCGMAVDTERRCVFVAEYATCRVTVHHMDSGRLIAALHPTLPGQTQAQTPSGMLGDVAVVDDVLIVCNPIVNVVHFIAIDSIPFHN